MVECGRPVMHTSCTFLRFKAGRIEVTSSLSPELDKATTTSPSTIMPKSPWAASAGCTKKAGVPVEAMVAAILRLMWPDLPIPITTTRPRQFKIASTACTKASSSPRDTSCKASASVLNTCRAHSVY